MATSASSSSSILQPEQQQVAGAGEEASSSGSAWQSSGSIGPFFAVISVLTVLAVLSCYLSRVMWNRRAPTPLESIKGRGFVGWVKRRFGQCLARYVEKVGGVGAKVMVCDDQILEGNGCCNVKDGGGDVTHHQNLPQV